MGLIVPSLETQYGMTIPNAYICVAKDMMSGTINIMEMNNMFIINAYYKIYASKDSRTNGKTFMTSDAIQISVDKDKLQNVFVHIYEKLKEKYPNATDDI